MVEHLAEALETLDPENAAVYHANAEALQAELEMLHGEYTTALAACTLDEVITSHDAFGYLAARYDFTIHAIGGLSTQDTPSAVTLASLREEAEEGIGAILLEENSIAAYGETLAAETGLQTLPVNPLAYVIPEETDYLSLSRANLESFKTALNCNG
jgi:zinc transport system substrate-binding protein